MQEAPRVVRPIAGRLLDRLKEWDLDAAARVDHFIANSELTRQRIGDFWCREAVVIHPPVDVERFSPAKPADYLLVVGELVPHKRVDVALEAARRTGLRIKVVGGGPSLGRLADRYPEAALLGRVSDHQLPELYAQALALVVPNVEEFGIAAVEAQAAGRPVIAIDGGGAREMVIPGETGVLVPGDVPDALAEALAATDFEGFDPQRIRSHALGFSAARFKQQLMVHLRHLGLDAGRPSR